MKDFADRFTWHPLAHVVDPPPNGRIVQVLRDHWWVTNDRMEVCMFDKRFPQCNSSQNIVEVLSRQTPGGIGAMFVPLAFVPVDVRDYG